MVNKSWMHFAGICLLAVATAVACGAHQEQEVTDRDAFTNLVLVDGKGDLARNVKVIDDISLNSEIIGKFTSNVRVYGYVFEARKGASVRVTLDAIAGSETPDMTEGEALDTVLAIYGPFSSPANPGAKLAESGAGPGEVAPEPVSLEVLEDGRYLVVFMSYQPEGNAHYRVELGCDGTAYQCRQPEAEMRPCTEGTMYIQGNRSIATDTTWDVCTVVLLETTTVERGAILTIAPGVVVQGNFIADDDNEYGIVALNVEGTLQAIGTETHPILFTALREKWRGIVLHGEMSALEHVFIDSAYAAITAYGKQHRLNSVNISRSHVGVDIAQGSVLIESSILEGVELTGTGVRAVGGESSVFHKSIVSNFEYGVHATTSEVELVDSTILNNRVGLMVTEEVVEFVPPYVCPDLRNEGEIVHHTPSPEQFRRDAVVQRTDIVNNRDYGVYIDAPQQVVVQQSNIYGNGHGVLVKTHSLDESSRITDNNLYGNGNSPQLASVHFNGVLDISENFWNAISDPELSASWKFSHSQEVTCERATYTSSTTLPHVEPYTCEQEYQSGNRYRYQCTLDMDARWTGEFIYTGFSPTELEAGPSLETLSTSIINARERAGL